MVLYKVNIMAKPLLWRFCLICLVLLVAGVCFAEQDIPPLKVRVTDLTNTLTQQEKNSIETKLAAFEQEKGAQIAVLIVPTTAPEAIEQYSIRVFEAWKLGRKGVDDGVLLLVAKNDKKMRLEVGYGLEGVLPDAIAKRIISEVISPHFKQGNFAGGITAGVDAMMKVIGGEPLPAPQKRSKRSKDGLDGMDKFMLVFFVVLLSGAIGNAILRRVFGKFIGSVFTFSLAAVAIWFILASLLWAIIVGFVAVFVSLAMAGGTGGQYYGGGGFGGGGFGSSSGGDSFSGGGGDSGGGGASGDW